ncbi:hypothetical protein [uncultured Proteiniphilum sp.]|uniref:hypothetical protein n=1 Tax=uncultured Proteiniphilum sp. TaxID=497637 RepID=UPI00262C7B13|nr:hypothetical protein [uncultured Proteiniphilum sp.]
MKEIDFIQALGFSAPMSTALICALLCLLHYRYARERHNGKHMLLMAAVFMAAFLCWALTILYFMDYAAFVHCNPIYVMMLTLDMVFLYHFIFLITRTNMERGFSPVHYILPPAFMVVMGIWSAFVPFEVKYSIVESRGEIHPAYPGFSLAFSLSPIIFCVYCITYVLMGFRRVRKYRKAVVDYFADTERTSMKWHNIFMALALVGMPVPFATLLIEKTTVLSARMAIAGSIIFVVQYVLLVYIAISEKYIVIEPFSEQEKKKDVLKASAINRRRFEQYLAEKKPFTNPNLRITDIAADMNTNRTYISNFINSEYGMNFSRFINICRLRELNKLRNSQASAKNTSLELILMAGFNTYRSYIRAKSEEDRLQTLKVSE